MIGFVGGLNPNDRANHAAVRAITGSVCCVLIVKLRAWYCSAMAA